MITRTFLRLLATLAVMGSSLPVDAAIVNSLRGFDRDEPGLSGSIAGSYGASGGNTDQSTFVGTGRLQWQGQANTWKLIASGKRTTSGGVETANSVLGHLRHNYDLSDRWATLAFLQSQQNPFQRLDYRRLLGLGLRWDAVKTDGTVWSIGAAHMIEQEKIQDEDGTRHATRLSAFTSFETELRDGVVLDALLFYQPRWSDFSDFRVFGLIQLDIELNHTLSLFTGYQIEHNDRPPAGVEQTDWTTKTGFRANF
jgi:putative salt-induced outer membrane protein YdiY